MQIKRSTLKRNFNKSLEDYAKCSLFQKCISSDVCTEFIQKTFPQYLGFERVPKEGIQVGNIYSITYYFHYSYDTYQGRIICHIDKK